MNLIHKNLTPQKWAKSSLFEQMANIGSEVHRTITWRNKNPEYSRLAFERSLELFDLTTIDKKNSSRLGEILRARELWCDYIDGNNQYGQNDEMWEKYFYAFNYAARR